MRISIIVAAAENGVIGRGGQLPWRLSADLKRFKQVTVGHAIIMGRRTWESIGRPLPGRKSIVVTRQPNYRIEFPEVIVADGLDQAFQIVESTLDNEAFVVGGAELYRTALPRAKRLNFTRVNANVEGDTFFPEIAWNQWRLIESEQHAADDKNEYPFAFEVYERC
jgi:dihydrofolate reductase